MATDRVYHQSCAILIIVLNAISFLSLAFVLSIYIARWKKITSFPIRLSFYLCIACIVQNLYILMLNPVLINRSQMNDHSPTSGFCVFEGILKVSSDLSSIIWTTLIIYSSYASIVQKKNLEQAEISYLIIGFLFCILVAIMYFLYPMTSPVFFKLYGYDTYECWFNAQSLSVEFGLKMGYYYVPLWIGFFLTIFMSSKVYRVLKQLGLAKRELTFFKRLMLFPFIMLGTGLFSTVNLIYNYASNDFPEWLDILATMGIASYGFANSLAYGFNPVIREQILIVIRLKKEQERDQTQMSEIGNRSDRNTSRLSDFLR